MSNRKYLSPFSCDTAFAFTIARSKHGITGQCSRQKSGMNPPQNNSLTLLRIFANVDAKDKKITKTR